MNDKKQNQPLSADALADLALSAVKRVPLSSDELRELAAPVAEATDETAAVPPPPPPSPFDIDAIRERAAYIEAATKQGRYVVDRPELPCMNPNCQHGGKIEIDAVRKVDDWVHGRNLCADCAAARFLALPPDQQDAITALNEKATDALYAGNWGRLSDAEYDRRLAQAQRYWDEAHALEDVWIYGITPQDTPLPLDGTPVDYEIEDDLPF